MNGRKKTGRNAVAIVLSAALHLGLLLMVLSEPMPAFHYPPPAPPVEAEIVPMPETPPIPPIPPPPTPPSPIPQKPVIQPPPQATPPQPQPPKPQPAPAPPATAAAPPRPAPDKPAPEKPAPVKPAPTPAPAPKPAAPAPVATPKPVAALPKAAPTPGPPKPAAPAPIVTPSPLNIHKAEKKAPAGTPTLPMAPAAGQPGSPVAGAPPSAGAPGQSRLTGLRPYPYGAMPSGGPGLRGSLIGCANARAVGLSATERNHCNDRFGADAAQAPVFDPISPAKRAAFDKAADRQESDRDYRSAAMPVGTAPSGHGFGAGLGPDQPTGVVRGTVEPH